jgi:hypothetical protein
VDDDAARTQRSYFSPQRGWSEEEEGAILRLDASVLERRLREGRNALFARAEDGSWRPILGEELSAVERGFVWGTWPTVVEGTRYRAFRGRRALDGELAQTLLAGLAVRDEEGVLVEAGAAAGFVFLLSEEDALVFAARVKELRGQIVRSSPIDPAAEATLDRLETLVAGLEAARSEDETVLRAARAGDLSGLESFEARTPSFLAAQKEVALGFESLRRALGALRAQAKTRAERAAAEVSLRRGRQLRHRASLLREARDEDASELALLAAGETPSGEDVRAQAVTAAHALARVAERQGRAVTFAEEGAVVHLPHGDVLLGERLDFLPRSSS